MDKNTLSTSFSPVERPAEKNLILAGLTEEQIARIKEDVTNTTAPRHVGHTGETKQDLLKALGWEK